VFGRLVHDIQLIAGRLATTWAREVACIVLGELFTAPAHRSGVFVQDVMTVTKSVEGRDE
jgi:hypothetical protein